MLSKKEIKNIAELARLKLNSKDVNFYTNEISAILEYVNELNKINTDNIEQVSNVKELFSVYRKDDILDTSRKSFTRERLLKLVPFQKKNFIKVINVFKQ